MTAAGAARGSPSSTPLPRSRALCPTRSPTSPRPGRPRPPGPRCRPPARRASNPRGRRSRPPIWATPNGWSPAMAPISCIAPIVGPGSSATAHAGSRIDAARSRRARSTPCAPSPGATTDNRRATRTRHENPRDLGHWATNVRPADGRTVHVVAERIEVVAVSTLAPSPADVRRHAGARLRDGQRPSRAHGARRPHRSWRSPSDWPSRQPHGSANRPWRLNRIGCNGWTSSQRPPARSSGRSGALA